MRGGEAHRVVFLQALLSGAFSGIGRGDIEWCSFRHFHGRIQVIHALEKQGLIQEYERGRLTLVFP